MIEQLAEELEKKLSFKSKMELQEVQSLIAAALKCQQQEYDNKLELVTKQMKDLTKVKTEIQVFEEVKIIEGIRCDESLDVVKSVPEFDGKQETYVSWRQAAHTAYKVFERFNGSSKHYQAVAVIRNKVRGSADAVLASFNTVLNFQAIIARLDFTYSDKRPIYLIEQELSTLRQGGLSVAQYYDEVEKKLTLLTNKTIMTYDAALSAPINEKYRADAMRVFISGLKRSLGDILFSAQPSDLPSALALAQEVEANHERYAFASNFAKVTEERVQPRNRFNEPKVFQGKSPYYLNKGQPEREKPNYQGKGYLSVKDRQPAPNTQEPMDIDPSSSKFKQPTNYQNNQSFSGRNQNFKRANTSERTSGQRRQRINCITQEDTGDQAEDDYRTMAESEADDIEESSQTEQINFLEVTPYCRSYNGQ